MAHQTLPIFEELIANRGRYHEYDALQGKWVNSGFTRDAMLALVDAKRVLNEYDIPDPEQGDLNLEKTLAHTTLPYPLMWIEWGLPTEVVKETPELAGTRVAALLMSAHLIANGSRDTHWDNPMPGTVLANSWQASVFMMKPGNSISQVPGKFSVALDHQGMYLGVAAAANIEAISEIEYDGEVMSDEDRARMNDSQAALMARISWGAVMTIGWMNCKNVEVIDHQRIVKVSVASKGKGKKTRNAFRPLDYHTIRLPGQSPGGGAGTGTGGEQRMHTVRGHFKTFTKERPLLGRGVGTYWWGWQVRGNPSRGVSVADYNMKARRA